MFGQRKMSYAGTGKGNMSRVSSELLQWDLINCEIWNRTMFYSTVVVVESSHDLSTGLVPWRSQISSTLLP